MRLGDKAQVNFMILFTMTTLIRKLLTYAGSSSLFLFWTFSVHAQGVCTTPAPTTATTHANIMVPPNVAVGGVMGPWITMSPNDTWNCAVGAYLGPFPVPTYRYTHYTHLDALDGLSSGGMITVEGKSYRQYYVNQGGRQVGFILEHGSSYQPMRISVGEPTSKTSSIKPSTVTSKPFSYSDRQKIRFIKTSTINPVGTFNFQVTRRRGTDWNRQMFATRISRMNVTFTAVTGTCNISTSPATVQLGSVYLHKIPNPGNAAAAVPFTVQFNNCPVGYSSIKYRFEAFPNPGNFAANGVLPAMPPSLATGVGVQVLQNNGTTPIAFSAGNFNYTLGQYTSSPGQSTYNVPLRARLIRRDANATAGSVFAQMQVVAQYN